MVYSIPDLPLRPTGDPWSPQILQAIELIRSAYEHAGNILSHEDTSDLIRLQMAASQLEEKAPLFEAMQASEVPAGWIQDVAFALAIRKEQLLMMTNQTRDQ